MSDKAWVWKRAGFGKLVRDRTIELIEEDGRKAEGHQEYNAYTRKEHLINKIAEESEEVVRALREGSLEELVEELADVIEVITAIAKEYNIHNLLEVCEEKTLRRGSFDKFLILTGYEAREDKNDLF